MLIANHLPIKDKISEIADDLLPTYPKIRYRKEISQKIIPKPNSQGYDYSLSILKNINKNKSYRVTIDFYFQIFMGKPYIKNILKNIKEINDNDTFTPDNKLNDETASDKN